MENKVLCEICGGADFYQEAGFYYCNECLTQTQEILEHTLEVPMQEQSAIIEPPKRKSSRNIQNQEKKQQITTWECYNYIILGVVEELIQLGAKAELKPTVMNLWFMYLKKLEVLHHDPLEPPRLPPFNNAGDAEAIYGHIPRCKRKIKKRRLSNSSSSADYSNISARNQNLIRGKKRRAMAITEYEERMSLGQSTVGVSLANQTLQSLKSDSDISAHIKPLKFNTSAEEILLKIMTKEHLDEHKQDSESEMTCHFSRRKIPRRYASGPMILTRNKIYAIIYLGLLLVTDNIQLGDMLRFIREGQISYQYIDHFFPEDLANCELKLNKNFYCSMNPILHYSTREASYKLAQLIQITEILPLQNIVKLAERYVAELNLPNEIKNYVLKLISRTEPVFKIPRSSRKIPNYEARVGSFIVFVLKLLFGLDGVTEVEMSQSAKHLNENQNEYTYFNYIKWRDFIEYRKVVIGQFHFPTQHLFDSSCNKPGLYCDFLSELMQRQQIDGNIHQDVKDVEYLLNKLNENSEDSRENVTFLPTLTPFKSYLSVIKMSGAFKNSIYNKKILLGDFREDSIDFIVHPTMHYPGKVLLEHKGANENIHITKMKYRKKLADYDFYKVTLCNQEMLSATKGESDYSTLDPLEMFINEDVLDKQTRKKNKIILKSCCRTRPTKLASGQSDQVFLHYLPEERFWINSTNIKSWDCHEEFEIFFEKIPYNFQLLIREMTRITEQTIESFMEEYINVELFMKHYYDFELDESIIFQKNRKRNSNEALNNVIERVYMSW